MFKDKTTSALVILNIIFAVLMGILLQTYGPGSSHPAEVQPVDAAVPEGSEYAGFRAEDYITPQCICLDPGHAIGSGAGNHAYFGETESEIVWIIATLLETRLEELGYEVIKTRTDPYVDTMLSTRAQIANACNADLFLSLHCDMGGYNGYAFYVPDVPGCNEDKTGPPEAIRLRSRELAEELDREIGQVGPIKANGVKSEELTYAGGKQGSLTISIYAEVPIITLELGFLDNETDGPFLASATGKISWVEALAWAIVKILPPDSQGQDSPAGPRLDQL